MDTLSESIYDNMTKLASEICETPIALVSLVDENRQWFKSRFGVDTSETPRDFSFCGHAILESDIFEIPDSTADSRFSDNPLVHGPLNVVFYAGAPLKTSTGLNLGTLCVIDHQPRKLTASQKKSLSLLANQVTMLIEMRSHTDLATHSVAKAGAQAEAVSQDWFKLRSIFQNSKIGLALLRSPELIFEKINREFERLANPREYENRQWSEVYQEQDKFPGVEILLEVLNSGVAHTVQEAPVSILNSVGKAEPRFIDFNYTRVLDPHGMPYGILVQAVDITDLVSARERSITERNVYETTLTSIGDGVIAVSADAIPKIQFLNSVAEKMTGWSAKEALGRPVDEVFQIVNPKTRAKAPDPIGAVLRSGQTQSLTNRTALISRSKREYIIEDSAAPIKSRDGRTTGVVLVFRDISEKHFNDERMLLLQSLIERSQDFVGVAKPDGQGLYMNPAGRRLIGLDPTDDIGQTKFIDFFGVSEQARIQSDVIPKVMEEGHWDGRVLFQNFQTGEQIPVSWNALTIPESESGGIAAIACISKDLREIEAKEFEIKKSRELLERNEEQLSLVVAVSGVGYYDWNIQSDRFELNEQFSKLFRVKSGASMTEALKFIHPDDQNRVFEKVMYSIANHTPYYEDFRLLYPDGVECWVRAHGQAFYDRQGIPKRFFGTITDVTKHRQSEENLRNILNNMPHFAALLSPKGEIRLVNQTAAQIMAKNPEDLMGLPLNKLDVWTEAPAQQIVTQALRDAALGKTTRLDIACTVTSAGRPSQIFVDFFMAPLFDQHGHVTGILNTGADITARKKLERELADARDEADRANSAKSAFLANMSHEIRSPLGAIMGFSEVMRNQALTRDELLNFVSIIDRNSNHLLRVVDDILDLAKVEAGKMLIEQVEFSLPELLADFASLMGLRAREKGIDFELRILTPLPDVVKSDPTRLRQILNNVVGNALKFTEKGEVSLSASFADNQLSFSVKDTGPGLTPAQINKLFRPFHQADVSTTRKYGGTGLGLVLTRKLAEALGGNFDIRSSIVGQGSVFAASITVKVPKRAQLVHSKNFVYVTDRLASVLTSHKELRGMNILVVDDSPDNQFLFELMLKQLGSHVDIAGDGLEGVDLALRNTYDVILMDVQMPKMDGHQATRALRAKKYLGPIIALTAHAMKEERERATTSGFTGFLSKPVNRDALMSVLKPYRD